MNHSLQPYPEYKDSGVPWLGKIPTHWNISTFRTLATPIKGRQPNQLYTTQEKDTDDLPYLSMDYIRNTHPEFPKYAKKSPHTVLAAKGDILLLWDGANASEFFQAKSGIVSSTTALIKPKMILDKTFFYYASKIAEPYLRSQTTGMGIPHVDGTVLKHLRYGICPLEEQQAIARFLDEHDRVTRRYIRAQQRLIKLLMEQKQALIQQAVTRGLNPDVPLKDSGIEWLGKIPEHWEVLGLKRVSAIIDGDRGSEYPNVLDFVSHGIPFLSSKCLVKGSILYSKAAFINKEKFNKLGQGKLQSGDLVITVRGTIGNAAIFFGNEYDTAFINAQMMILRPKCNILSRFLLYVLQSHYWKTQIDIRAYGSAQQQLTNQILSDIKALTPPVLEQAKIVDYLDSIITTINHNIQQHNHIIHLIREYRTRLIADMVTGKLDVRGL